MAETDTNAYDSTFTDFHALPFTLRSSAMPAMPQPFFAPPPPWHEFLVFSIGVNLLWPVIRDERGPVRYLVGMNWVINRPWVPLLWPWYQVAKAEKHCSGHLELAICPKSMFPDHKHPKPLCCPAGLGAQAKLFPR